jgi:hypothetical protein
MSLGKQNKSSFEGRFEAEQSRALACDLAALKRAAGTLG